MEAFGRPCALRGPFGRSSEDLVAFGDTSGCVPRRSGRVLRRSSAPIGASESRPGEALISPSTPRTPQDLLGGVPPRTPKDSQRRLDGRSRTSQGAPRTLQAPPSTHQAPPRTPQATPRTHEDLPRTLARPPLTCTWASPQSGPAECAKRLNDKELVTIMR